MYAGCKYLHYMYICTLQVYIRKSPICGYGHRLVGQILKLSQTPLSKRKYIVNLWPSTKKHRRLLALVNLHSKNDPGFFVSIQSVATNHWDLKAMLLTKDLMKPETMG